MPGKTTIAALKGVRGKDITQAIGADVTGDDGAAVVIADVNAAVISVALAGAGQNDFTFDDSGLPIGATRFFRGSGAAVAGVVDFSGGGQITLANNETTMAVKVAEDAWAQFAGAEA